MGGLLFLEEQSMETYPLGKLPAAVIARLAERFTPTDPRVILGPGVGLDCAVIDFGDRLLVAKTDPITFTSDEIGWYAVQVSANDVATTGAQPAWFLVTALLPDKGTDQSLVESIFEQIYEACRSVGAAFVGGHTEVTAEFKRTVLVGTMLGEVTRDRLITPRGAQPGDSVLLTKWIPIEAISILTKEFVGRLGELDPAVLEWGSSVLKSPGISVVKEALLAAKAGGVTAMHDPTEGGLAGGLWELAEAAQVGLEVDLTAVPVPTRARAICQTLGIDPISAIASGSLVVTVEASRVAAVEAVLASESIPVARIGRVIEGSGVHVRRQGKLEVLPQPPRDAIAQLFENR